MGSDLSLSASGVQAVDSFRALAAGRLPPGTSHQSLPRLRFDRVAQRLVRDLQAILAGVTTETTTLVVTVAAPIRLPARTVRELGVRLRSPGVRTFDETVCGNRVRARIVRRGLKEGPRVIVFIHNPEPAPNGLFTLVEALLSPAQA
jgi:hypothetical protein